MIKGVVFDLDHTLYDRYGTIEEGASIIYEKFSKRLAPGLGIEDVAVTMIYADKNFCHLGWNKICDYLNGSGFFTDPITLEEYTEIMQYVFSKVAVPFPFVYDMLDQLRDMGCKIGLITNGRQIGQSEKLQMLGLEKAFDEIIICSTPEMRKPNALPFETMAQKLGLSPSELMYVGDHPKNDVDASRRVGYTPVWVRTTGIWLYDDIEKCEYQVDTVAEIPDIIEKLN